jgi:hypothetical protein
MHRSAMYQMGLESLIQRGKSPFFTDLVSVYQDSQKGLRELPDLKSGDVYHHLQQIKFSERIKDIVFKYTGILLSWVRVYNSTMPNLVAKSSINPPLMQRKAGYLMTSGMIHEKINSTYNDRTGVITNPDVLQLGLSFSLNISVAWWTMRNHDGSFYLTPEEFAAFTLHEIGHIDHAIRSYSRVTQRIQNASDIVTYITTNADNTSALELVAQLKKSKDLTAEWRKVLAVCEAYFKTQSNQTDSTYTEALNMVVATASAEAATNALGFYNRDVQLSTKVLKVDDERSADEYASRNGAYAALTSALKKLEDLNDKNSILYYQQVKTNKVAMVLASLRTFKQLFRISAEDINGNYDPFLKRVELITETAKHAFQDADLPDDIKKDLHQQIAECESYIDEFKASAHHRTRMMLKTWVDNVGKLGRIVKAPFQVRLVEDYERLQNETRSLTRNQLFYLADKR